MYDICALNARVVLFPHGNLLAQIDSERKRQRKVSGATPREPPSVRLSGLSGAFSNRTVSPVPKDFGLLGINHAYCCAVYHQKGIAGVGF
jgi:hypothetical protein